MCGAVLLVIMAVLVLMALPAAVGQQQLIVSQDLSQLSACDSDMQIVMCGQLPFTALEDRRSCCEAYGPVPEDQMAAASAAAAAAAQAVPTVTVQGDVSVMQIGTSSIRFEPALRSDLLRAQRSAQKLNYNLGSCLPEAQVLLPSFYYQEGQHSTTVGTTFQRVPQLSSNVLAAVKSNAINSWPWGLRAAYNRIARTDRRSGFIHPAGYAGPAELALMQYRLGTAAQIQSTTKRPGPPQAQVASEAMQQRSPVTEAALYSLISGAKVPPKVYPGPWWPPTDCSARGFHGPYPMSKVSTVV